MGRLDIVDGGRYAPKIGVLDVSVTTLHITTFGPWKRINSRLHPVVRSHDISPTPPCATPALAGRAGEQKMLYPSLFLQYAAVEISVLLRTMSSKPHSLTDQTACAIPDTLPPRMLGVPLASPGGCGCGCGGWPHGSSGAEWRR